MHLTKGVHIVIDYKKLPVKQSVYFEGPDHRMIFAIPRDSKTYIGTTDTDYKDSCEAVVADVNDVRYLINAAVYAFEGLTLSLEDVESSWVGLRPLIHEDGKSASELSRKDEVFISASGLISIAGGKLTGYRKMAERVVDLVGEKLASTKNIGICKTDQIKLNNDFSDVEAFIHFQENLIKQYQSDWQKKIVKRLARTYGAQATEILSRINNESLHGDHKAFLIAEAQHTIECEMAVCLSDFFVRRTGLLYFDIEFVKLALDTVLEVFRKYFDWPEEKCKSEIDSIHHLMLQASGFH